MGKAIDGTAAFLTKFEDAGFGELVSFPDKYKNAAIPIIKKHPRVYIDSATLKKIRANFRSPENIEIYEALMQSVNKTLALTDAPYEYQDLIDSITYIEELAFAYLATKKQSYGYKAICYAFNLIEKMGKLSCRSVDEEKLFRSTSTALHTLAEVYDWCYGLFTDKQRRLFINGACNNVARHMEIGYPPTNIEPVVGHGAERPLMRDWLAFAIATADEEPQIYSYVCGCLMTEYLTAPEFYYSSGLQMQGSAYGLLPRLYPNMAMDQLLFNATGKRVYKVDLSVPVLSAIHRIRPDNESLRVGDDYNNTPSKYDMRNLAAMAFFAGAFYKNPTAKAWARFLGVPISQRASELSRVMYLISNDPDIPSNPDEHLYKELKLALYNPYPSGSVVARSAWGVSGAWMTYTNIEEICSENHDHKDSGTFQIYYKGILAPDTGMYEHDMQRYGSPYHYAYVKQTISKNGLLVYNPATEDFGLWKYSGGQRAQSDDDTTPPMTVAAMKLARYNRASVLGYSSAQMPDGSFDYTYISGDITDAYYKDTVKRAARATMTLATGDTEHPMMLMVYDRVTSVKPEYKKSFVLHTTSEPGFNGGARTDAPAGEDPAFTYIDGADGFFYDNLKGAQGAFDEPGEKYNGKLKLKTLLPEEPVYRYIGGDGKRFWIPGRDGERGENAGRENIPRHPAGEVGWGRVEISPKISAKTDHFLNLMYVSDAKDCRGDHTSDRIPESLLVRSLTHDGAVSFGKCVMFSKQNDRICLPFSFSTEGEGKLTYYVTGLAAGEWCVASGCGTQTVTVTDEGTVAVFVAAAGEISLSFMAQGCTADPLA